MRRNCCNQNLSKPNSGKLCTESQSAETHRLRPSTFSDATIGFQPRRRVNLWLEKIGAIETFSDSETSVLSTLWSNLQKKEALEFCKRSTGNTVLSPEFQDGNADKNPGDDWLGASSDGIVYELPLRSQGLLQIKLRPAKELCDKSVIKKPLTELRSFRPAPKHELYRDIVIDSKSIVDSSKLLMQEIGGDLRK
ncbi:hypothetical protein FEM48_Zijuj05G0174400 [Ziziphus jujuba var. spinosa]|uniref:Uncharacterized protein n=1 Tax=Ziziphus jujuba var. spinosa TaxID=714518 RepID=A0A978VG55_ZIZJJ|nr:hypothetical protein FEM48_Zijuj05G0174400 [Ziziphus jujuba var. spinosa]